MSLEAESNGFSHWQLEAESNGFSHWQLETESNGFSHWQVASGKLETCPTVFRDSLCRKKINKKNSIG